MGVKPQQPKEQFLGLASRPKTLDLAYVHVVESCVDNWYDMHRPESIQSLLEAWGSRTPVLVAGGMMEPRQKKQWRRSTQDLIPLRRSDGDVS